MHKRSLRVAVALATVTLLTGCSAVLGRSSGTKLTFPVLTGLPTAVGSGTSGGSTAGASANDLPPVANTQPRSDLPRYRAARAGALPAPGVTSLAGVPIPAGAAVASTARAGGAPTLWISTNVLPNVGQTLLKLIAAFPQTGLWPVVIDTVEPGIEHDFDPSSATSVDVDPHTAFGDWWQQNMGTGPGGDLDTFASAELGTTFPGLQTPSGVLIPDALTAVAAKAKGKLGLVSVTRPADIAVVTGWLGPTNYLDPGQVTVALRSWEDRYGIEPIELGFDFLSMGMVNPPKTTTSQLDLAAEQFAVCPDQLEHGQYDTIVQYADSLQYSPELDCWWD